MSGPLVPALEYAIFASLLKGELGPEMIDEKSLSQVGQKLHQAAHHLVKEKGSFDEASLRLIATEVYGLDPGRIAEYMAMVSRAEVPAAGSIYNLIRDRGTLMGMANEISRQLTDGNLDVSKLQLYFTNNSGNQDMISVAEDLEKGVPVPPAGPKLETLPRLSEVTNGIYGFYLLAGMPGIGKSTLGQQIAIEIAKQQSVLIYDYENGKNMILHHLVQNWGIDAARRFGKNLYIRESLRTLTRDLAVIRPPATILVDSIQKLSSRSGDDRRTGLDEWVLRLEGIKREQGYSIVLISEINRANYTGDPRMDCFKETGSLEYAADSAVVLQEADAGMVRVHIIKNRHYKFKGQLGLIERDNRREFWFKEADMGEMW